MNQPARAEAPGQIAEVDRFDQVDRDAEVAAPRASLYRDPKRHFWILSLLIPCVVFLGPSLHALTGATAVLWLPIVLLYGGIPLVDLLVGEDRANPPELAVPALQADRHSRRITYALVPLLWASFIFEAWFVATRRLPAHGLLAVGITGGTICGFGLIVGHELGHQHNRLETWLARFVLSLGCYGHFTIEHNKGHHRDVATPEDSASARMGESIYRFCLREIPGGLRRAWRWEQRRLRRLGKPVLGWGNQILTPLLISGLLYGSLLAALGPAPIPFFLLTVLIGAFLLSTANYVEHYGLLRETGADGRYEPCQPRHSWNTNHRFSGWTIFHLQRHSDHHANPTRRYQCLRHFDDLPTLPSGYWGMFVLAWLPPLWFRIMDPRLVAAVGGRAARINFVAGKRDRLVARHGLDAASSHPGQRAAKRELPR